MNRFLIAPFDSGLQTDVKPFMIPDSAFAELKNATIFRGRIKKRFGSQLSSTGATTNIDQALFSRCAVKLAKTDAGTGILTATAPGLKWKVGQQFSVGTGVGAVIFTVVTTGANQDMIRSDGSAEQAKFSTTTGAFTIEATAFKDTYVYFYPLDPIMGLSQFETTPVNNQVAYAFDTQFPYVFTGGRWLNSSLGLDMAGKEKQFHGDDGEFFWTTSYQGVNPEDTVMFVTNFHAVQTGAPTLTDDPMWYFNGTAWTTFAPTVVTAPATKTVVSARIIIPFHRRLLMLDTIEQVGGSNKRFKNRCRFSHDGSPIDATNYAWLEPNQTNYQGGGYVDASSQEGIISVEFIKDRLIVYFERSTWELAYTSNEIEPFVWLKLNTELGSESTYSTVPFDKVVLTIGSNGIHGCNGSNVERVDENIPDYIFQFDNENSGPTRVHGIRDYKTEMVYWTVPLDNKCALSYFPNTVLTYNYKNNSWGENDDCFTAFGYFEQTEDATWQNMNTPWDECNFAWNSYVSIAKERKIIAGNQQGSIVVLNPELTSNARSLSVTNFIYDPVTKLSTVRVVDHTLQSGDFVRLYDLTGVVWDALDERIHQVISVTKDTFTLNDCLITSAAYLGGGSCSRVSRISIKSKQWNFYLKEGKNFLINKMDFYVTKTSGKITTDFILNSTTDGMVNDAIGNDVAQGDYKIDLGGQFGMEKIQERIWRSQYFQADGNCIQLWLYVDDNDMKIVANAASGLEIHAIMIYARPTANAMQGYTNEL